MPKKGSGTTTGFSNAHRIRNVLLALPPLSQPCIMGKASFCGMESGVCRSLLWVAFGEEERLPMFPEEATLGLERAKYTCTEQSTLMR